MTDQEFALYIYAFLIVICICTFGPFLWAVIIQDRKDMKSTQRCKQRIKEISNAT